MADIKLPKVPNSGAGKTELNTGNSTSRVDEFSGQHTTSLIVAILFVVLLICLVIIICVKSTVDAVIYTGMFSLLSGLMGFFTGTKVKKD